jgi:hypothetical protein
MAAGDSALTICSDALLLLGAAPISSFNEGTDEANVCDRLYPDVRDSTLQMYPWAFSMKKVQLARTVNTPVNEWLYEYQLPSDRIGPPRAAFDSAQPGARPFQAWEIYGDKFLTNEEKVYIDYQYSIAEGNMPVWFVQLLKYQMAWHLAEPITDQISKTDYWKTIAMGSPGENNRGGYMRTAMNIDAQGNTPQSIEDYSLIAVRY